MATPRSRGIFEVQEVKDFSCTRRCVYSLTDLSEVLLVYHTWALKSRDALVALQPREQNSSAPLKSDHRGMGPRGAASAKGPTNETN